MRVCWIGNPRYTKPLNTTEDKKWQALDTLGIEMYVISFADGLRPRRFRQHAHFYLLPSLPLSILRYAEMFLMVPFLAMWMIFQHGISVIIAQSPYEGAVGALAKMTARLVGRRVALVIESHGDFESLVFRQRKIAVMGIYRWFMTAAARYAFRYTDLLRPVSSVTEKQLRGHAPNVPIQRFMAWTDSATFRETARRKGLTETHDIVYAGVLTPLKGVHFLIDAFARISPEFPDACLWLVGKPENRDYAQEINQQIERLGLQNQVKPVGAVSQVELAGYMGGARVVVLASTTEGLPRVLIEAMLCGTPVIASRVGGIPDIIQDGENGYLVPAGDVDALAGRLTDLLRDPQIEVMGQRARAFAEQFFSESAYVEGYRKLIETAARLSNGKKD